MNRDRRRQVRLLALLAVLLLAGCTAAPGSEGEATGSPTPARTATPALTPTETPGECVAVAPATVDPVREGVEPSERPDPPREWNRSSVERYVVAFEEAYSRNAALRRDTREVTVVVGDVAVERRDGAWMVDLVSRTNTWVQGRASGTGTATVVHGDGASVPVTYRVTDRALYREEGRIGGTPSASGAPTDGARDWTTVACFDT